MVDIQQFLKERDEAMFFLIKVRYWPIAKNIKFLSRKVSLPFGPGCTNVYTPFVLLLLNKKKIQNNGSCNMVFRLK